MLTVPHLKPGQAPYDPSTTLITQSPHSPNSSTPTTADPTTILNHALIKDAVTSLHQEDDTHFATLQQYSALQLCTLIKDHQTFLDNQKNKYLNNLPSQTLKHLFLTTTQPYFAWSIQRAEVLYNNKVESYRHDVTERQNEEFLNRALQPENAFNDTLQTTYKDMILFNLDTLLESLPTKERKQRLDQASQAFYRKVIEKRLELDPSRLTSILHAPAIQHSLPAGEICEYETLADNAIQQEKWRTQAESWITSNTPNDTVQTRIAQSTKTETQQNEFLSIYDNLLYTKNRKQCLSSILNTINVWNLVVEDGAKPEAIPSWVTRGNPLLHDHIIRELSTYIQAGGLPNTTDYVYTIKFIQTFSPIKAFSFLADESHLYSFIKKTGGVHSIPFGIVLRLLLTSLNDDDNRWIHDLSLAKEFYWNRTNNNPNNKQANSFLKRFDTIRQIRIANTNNTIPDELEIHSLLNQLITLEQKPEPANDTQEL